MEEKSYEEILKERIGSISTIDDGARRAARERWDSLAKPVDGLGRFEDMVVDIAGASGSSDVRLKKKAVVVMCADHGVVEEGVSQTDRSVTVNVANAVAGGSSTINVMADAAGADVFAVDMGIAAGRECIDDRVIDMKVKPGTGNIAEGPAMTREEACRAVLSGMDMAAMLAERGYDIAVSGEMGIGNTTTSAAVTAALTGAPVAAVTGRGAGLSSEKLKHKIAVIEAALLLHRPNPHDPIDILHKVGGLDIAGLCGLYLGAAARRVPVVLDGVISCAAALLAARLCPQAVDFMVAAHRSDEPASVLLLEKLGKRPFLMAGMHLGEGTGAAAGVALLDLALAPYREMVSFADIGMEAYTPQK
mgnify:CR=1 FL=1